MPKQLRVKRCGCGRVPQIKIWETAKNDPDPDMVDDTCWVECECGMMTKWVQGFRYESTKEVVDIWNHVNKVEVKTLPSIVTPAAKPYIPFLGGR